MNTQTMKLHDPSAYRVMTEAEVIEQLLDLQGRRLLEPGLVGPG